MIHWRHRNEQETVVPSADIETTAFDTMWFGDANFPLSEEVFAALLEGGDKHVFVMPTTLRRAQVAPAHRYGHYDPRLSRANTHWRDVDAVELARQVIADHEKWDFGTPWVFSNEISYSQWRAQAIEEYRRWTVTFAQTLAEGGLLPALYSPMARPRAERNEWSALAVSGYVAIEGYLDAAMVLAARDPVGYSAGQYADIRSHFEAQGVAVDRCILVEHYSQTPATTKWGRGGLSLDDWLNVIAARIAGARKAGFALLGSYGWGYNRMGVTDNEIVETARAYVAASDECL